MNFATLSPADMNQYELQDVVRYAAFSLPQLKGATRFATKWSSWAAGKARQVWKPLSALLELFLGEQRARGVSVPRTDYLSMMWLSHHLGWKWALREVKQASSEDAPPPFVLFDFSPKRVPFSACIELDTGKMSADRFERLSKILFMSAPACLADEQVSNLTSDSGRRLLPTVAELLRYSADERVRIGGWLDAEEEIEVSKKGTIADVYADKKLDTSLMLKRELTQTVRTSIHNIGKMASTMEWEQVIRHAPSRKTARYQLMVNLVRPVQGRSLLTVKLVEPLSDASSNSCNMNASSSSKEKGVDSAGGGSIPCICWLRASAGSGRLHWLSAKCKPGHEHDSCSNFKQNVLMKCARLLVCPQEGMRLDTAEGEWSPRCFAKLTSRQQPAWRHQVASRAAPSEA
jgi:hypothetical protein